MVIRREAFELIQHCLITSIKNNSTMKTSVHGTILHEESGHFNLDEFVGKLAARFSERLKQLRPRFWFSGSH